MKIHPALPLLGIPIKDRINPILIVLLPKEININIKTINNTIILALKEPIIDSYCLQIIEESLTDFMEASELKLSLQLKTINQKPKLPCISIYSALTYALASELSNFYGVGVKDILNAISDIEEVHFNKVYMQFINACRQGIVANKSMVYRFGEGYVPINTDIINIECPGEIKEFKEDHIEYPESIMSALTHISGVLVLEAYNALLNSNIKYFMELIRIENALWYLLYHINIPTTNYAKWVTDFNRAYLIKIRFTQIDNSKVRR